MRFGNLIWLVGIAVMSTCCAAAEGNPDESALGEFFERKIRPLFAKHCYECHSVDTAEDNGHLAVDGRATLLAGGSRGPIVIPGKPEESLLIAAVSYGDPKLQMPPEGKLSAPEIELLSEWIRKSAYIPEYAPATQKKGKEIDWNTARAFWSFQPLQFPSPPQLDPSAPLEQPIDAFIQHELTQHDLRPSATADQRTLIRRLSFDLLGLPPSVIEVAEFIDDARPDAYERAVDRMLASPHFGERWARYWLDLARYTDVTPSWLKNADQAWLYRDWVIRALNEDLPYDLFVKRQLAADVMEQSNPEDYAALGLIGLSPTYWKEPRLAPSVIEVIVADEWDERIDAVSRTFLGLTVACARCHDHKFDPITTRDYYGMAGIFASTQLTDRPLLPSPLAERIAEARQRVDQLEESLKAMKDKECDEAKKLKTDIETIRNTTPEFGARMAHVVEEASIYVLPDGPEMTKLDIRKNQPRDLPVFRRGNPGNPGEMVSRRFIEVLSPSTPQPFVAGSGRREFVDALFNESRGLTARVIANRLWAHHFGRGLVRTPSDFGVQGDRPTHPALLEWLAWNLADNPDPHSSRTWTMKRLHRQMVTSSTYRQSSATASEPTGSSSGSHSFQLDPENQWLARMSRRRLDVEPWRDAMLVAASQLDDSMGGPAAELDLPSNRRRTLYGKVGRDEQNDMLRLYDFPPPTSHSPSRDATTTPLQQLFVLNSEFVETQAAAFAAKIQQQKPDATTDEKTSLCYQQLFQREPTADERQLSLRFLSGSGGVIEEPRWPIYLQSLFGLNELLFVD